MHAINTGDGTARDNAPDIPRRPRQFSAAPDTPHALETAHLTLETFALAPVLPPTPM